MADTAFEVLRTSIEEEANKAEVPITLGSGRADGFGMTGVATLDLSISDKAPAIRVWDEGGGDVWIELLAEDVTATWWRQGRREATLAEVLIALADGRYVIEDGLVSVSPRGRKSLRLRDRM